MSIDDCWALNDDRAISFKYKHSYGANGYVNGVDENSEKKEI